MRQFLMKNLETEDYIIVDEVDLSLTSEEDQSNFLMIDEMSEDIADVVGELIGRLHSYQMVVRSTTESLDRLDKLLSSKGY